MNEQQMVNKIKQMEPDFDVHEEMVIRHYMLKYEGLQPRQVGWWLAELSRLGDMLPMDGFVDKMLTLQVEAWRRAKEVRNG